MPLRSPRTAWQLPEALGLKWTGHLTTKLALLCLGAVETGVQGWWVTEKYRELTPLSLPGIPHRKMAGTSFKGGSVWAGDPGGEAGGAETLPGSCVSAPAEPRGGVTCHLPSASP